MVLLTTAGRGRAHSAVSVYYTRTTQFWRSVRDSNLNILSQNKLDLQDIFTGSPTVPNMHSLEHYDETYSSVLPYVA